MEPNKILLDFNVSPLLIGWPTLTMEELVERVLQAKMSILQEVEILRKENATLSKQLARKDSELKLKDKEIGELRNTLTSLHEQQRPSSNSWSDRVPKGVNSNFTDIQLDSSKRSVESGWKRPSLTRQKPAVHEHRSAGAPIIHPLSESLAITPQTDTKDFTRLLLTSGAVFTKYKTGRRLQNLMRFVWCDANCSNVMWGQRKSLNGKRVVEVKGSFPVKDLLEVRPGIPAKHMLSYASSDVCLLLVTTRRRLELQAENREKRDLWLHAFLSLVPKPATIDRRG